MMQVKLWSEGYKCMKKGIFCHTKSVAMMPKSRDHMPTSTTSLWGVAAKNGQLELWRRNWYFARETHKDTAILVWACQAGFWKSTGTQWGLRNHTHSSAHYTNGCDAVQQESQIVWIV